MSALRMVVALASLLPALWGCEEPPPPAPANVVVLRDINYAGTHNDRQTLDVYLPRTPAVGLLPLVVFIHGGGWEGGHNREHVGMIFSLIGSGDFVGASINYRLTDEAAHPAQIHDAKGAIRWLRARAKEYGIDPERIAVFGVSAGGHLASLLGTSGGVAELEGSVGGNAGHSSRVAAVINFCGPANLLTFGGKGSRIDPEDADSAIGKLLGGPLGRRMDIAAAASPVHYISDDDPPFLHIHGTDDDLVPYAQVREFDAALEAAGISSTVLTAENAGHVFFSRDVAEGIRAFLDRQLLGRDTPLVEGPVGAE